MCTRPRALLVALLLVVGCSDEDEPPLILHDSHVVPDGTAGFMQPCQKDTDCASHHCLQLGDRRRCTRSCSSSAPCPAFPSWACSGQSFCECTATGKQPTVCKVDGDCDGEPDKPPRTETCNEEDDDCDGTIDDVGAGTTGATLSYRDADGDGYGDDNVSKWLCKPATGWVTQKGDCDDSRKSDHPGAEEICGDNYDNNCNGMKEDTDVCGLTPPVVTDVSGNQNSGTLKSCAKSSTAKKSLDITEILGKQDQTYVKFTVRLAGAPALTTCSSYVLHLGDPKQSTSTLVYIYRPATAACTAAGLSKLEAYVGGQTLGTTAQVEFNAADPGHVAFVLAKSEFFPKMPSPTYRLKACTNATADAQQDRTACADDTCETPVHR